MSKEKAIIIAAIIAGIFGCITTLGKPFVEKMVRDSDVIPTHTILANSNDISSTEISLQQTSVALEQTQIAINNAVEVSVMTSTPIPVIEESNVSEEACIHPEILAQQKGWDSPWLVDNVYGGYNVTVSTQSELPSLWEANQFNSENQIIDEIHQYDSNRKMSSGVWVIYPPCNCRSEFGFKDC